MGLEACCLRLVRIACLLPTVAFDGSLRLEAHDKALAQDSESGQVT